MRIPRISAAILTGCLFLLICGAVLYSYRVPPEAQDREAFCADCLSYARDIDKMIRKTPKVRGNRQFFRYALDVCCRGSLFISRRCPNYRRSFLQRPDQFMYEIENPLEACRAIRAC
ncbi:hypothetical protein BDV59DRAFT_182753 [Aspergillus ambiguus]|uniref:uncharacterized protein n=1 Tax=Aspergillus ambiguus TaxID=176160 RepID=UPI003CCDC6F8